MALKSALEDLSHTTLSAVAGCLGRLEYLAGLRSQGGEYVHWGFQKTYGRANANQAIETAHHRAVSEVLSTPLGTLLQDVEISTAGVEVEDYLEMLSETSTRLLPKDPGPGSP